jgi:hypothetical protein
MEIDDHQSKRPVREEPAFKIIGGGTTRPANRQLLDFLVKRMALEEGIVLLLLNSLGYGLFVPLRKVARGRFTLFAGFGAFQGDGFLHGFKWVVRDERKAAPPWRAT